MFIRLFLIVAIYATLSTSESVSCTGKAAGYYCINSSSYAWCYGQATPATYQCAGGLTCPCGYTTVNPCTWPGQQPDSCTGKPGDIVNGQGSTEESSKPPQQSSKEEQSEKESSSSSKKSDSSTDPEQSNADDDDVPAPKTKVSASYFTNWPQYHTATLDGRSCRFTPENIDASHLTHIFYAFAVIDSSYQVVNFEWNDFDFYKAVQAKKQRWPHLKTLISIGGWNFNLNESTKYLFSKMASTKTSRAKFISSAITYAHTHGFDGVDIDWEYPAFEPQGGSPEDTENFTALLREFRAAIEADQNSKKLLLTIAAPAGEEKFTLLELNKIHKYVDFINLMCYDLHGSWDKVTNPHTSLYSVYSNNSTDTAVTHYLAAGVPAQKLVLGLAAYGRTWTAPNGATKYGDAADGAGEAGVCTQERGFLNSYEIAHMVTQGATEVKDEPSNTYYAYKGDQFVTYDKLDTHLVKLNYACEKGLGGAFLWAMDLDTDFAMVNQMYNIMQSSQCGESHESSSSKSDSSSNDSPLPPSQSSSSSEREDESECSKACLNSFKACTAKIDAIEKLCSCITQWGKCLVNKKCQTMNSVRDIVDAYYCSDCGIPGTKDF